MNQSASDTFASPMGKLIRFFCYCIFLFLPFTGYGQVDSAAAVPAVSSDTVSVSKRMRGTEAFPLKNQHTGDTSKMTQKKAQLAYRGPVEAYVQDHPYYKAAEMPMLLPSLERNPPKREWIFYSFIGVLLYLAILRLAFPKYFADLFRVFFNSSLRQKQIRDQLIQEPLPSLLMNLFFVISAGLFLYFFGAGKGLWKGYQTWMVLLFCFLLPAAVYLVKYFLLTAFGWIFGRKEGVDTYLFVVFMTNKILAIFLLPISIMLAYANVQQASVLGLIASVLLIVMGIYRLVRAYSAIHNSFRINQLQFLVYVAAFEVIPILLLYKGLNTLF
jgi:hypothetical protein